MPNLSQVEGTGMLACYLRLAERSVGQLLPQSGRWMGSDDRHTAKAIRTTTVITSFARTLSLTDRRSLLFGGVLRLWSG
jgi:hypothetical protein